MSTQESSRIFLAQAPLQSYDNHGFLSPKTNDIDMAFTNSQLPDQIQGITYSWNNINVFVKKSENGKRLFNCFRKGGEDETKQILKNVTGIAQAGQILAIMGPSGAGKTTLLNALTCRNNGKLNLSGERLINGVLVNRTTLTSVSAYIQQTDIFIGTLTPREHLCFHAALRMDQKIPYRKKIERVEEVMREMGLTSCGDTVIGIPGRVKGISGGQMKRLSIATEILSDPKILFFDEPTTGLDSFMALAIVKILKSLAAKGKTVVCTIHQPSSEVFALFDRLILLSEGRTAFIGDCNDALSFFESVNYPSPLEFNPADHFIFTLAIKAGKEKECLERSKFICDSFETTGYFQNLIESIQMNEQKTNEAAFQYSPYKAPWLTQFRFCVWRSWKTVLKDPLVLKARLAQAVFVSLVMGAVFFGQDKDQEAIQNINGFMFMLLANLTFSSVFPVTNVFWNELPVFVREHYNGVYRTDVYYLGKTLAEIPIDTVLPAIFLSISYWMIGLNGQIDRFLIAIAIAILISNVASSYGYMVSTLSSSLEMALGLSPVFIMPFMLFGGKLLNKDSIPTYFVWLKYFSWFLHGNEALCVNQWKGVENIACSNRTEACIESGEMVLETLSFKEENFELALILLGALIVLVRIISYIGLWAKTRSED